MASSGTRHSILDILKREGPQDAAGLARRLGITPMAVGLHLSSLEEEKLVYSQPEPSNPPRRGRPQQKWRLTEAASRIFPDAHAVLTVGLLSSLQEVYGEQGFRKLLEARTRQQVEEYRAAIPEGPLKDRVKALARIRCHPRRAEASCWWRTIVPSAPRPAPARDSAGARCRSSRISWDPAYRSPAKSISSPAPADAPIPSAPSRHRIARTEGAPAPFPVRPPPFRLRDSGSRGGRACCAWFSRGGCIGCIG